MNWIYYVLIANCIWSFTSLIDKIVISKGYIKNPLVYLATNGLMNILLIFFLPFAGFETLKFMDFLIALFSGAAFAASIALYYKAVEYEEISKIAILFQIAPVFVFGLSFLFLGEMLTISHFIGFLFFISAGAIVSYSWAEKSFKPGKAFYYMLASMFFGSIALVASKHIFTVTGFWSAFLWLKLAGFAAVGGLMVPSIRRDAVSSFKLMTLKIKGLIVFKMLIDFSAFIFSGYAISTGPISLITALGASVLPFFVFMLTLLMSAYFPAIVKEDISKKVILAKLFAIVLIAIGIAFINLA